MNTVDVLRRAKEEIADESRWGTRGLICSQTGRMCALGAIAKAVNGTVVDEEEAYLLLADHPAVVALAGVLDQGVSLRSTPVYKVFRFNDRLSGTREEHHAKVIDAFDRAILSLTAGLEGPSKTIIVEPVEEPLPREVEEVA